MQVDPWTAGNVSDPQLRQAGRLNVTVTFPGTMENSDRPSESKGNAVMKDTAVLISALDGVQYMVESIPTVSESDFRAWLHVTDLALGCVQQMLHGRCVYVCVPLRATIRGVCVRE